MSTIQNIDETQLASAGSAVMGRVFNIQRFSLHDGPGIRTTIFLKGCPLRCLWCHNPEGVDASPSVSFLPEKCFACGECVRACAHGAHVLEPGGAQAGAVTHTYDRSSCEKCGNCTEHCDSAALEFVGRSMIVDDVMKEVVQDRAFYNRSGGGLTISGGEPLAQIDFTLALLRAAREQGIHRCVETSGFATWKRIEPLLPMVNLFLYDWKETDAQRHKEFTGQSNQLILENLGRLHSAGAKVQLQCPLVPGFNDRRDHFEGIVALVKSLPNFEGVQLLPFHPLGESKLQRFGLSASANLPRQPMDAAKLDHWAAWLRKRGVRVLNAAAVPANGPPP
jgi:pyruvate formate lyase activating enzyme